MNIDNKTELLMLLVALENSSELILNDERAEEWHERTFVSLFNRITYEYSALVEEEEDVLVELLAH